MPASSSLTCPCRCLRFPVAATTLRVLVVSGNRGKGVHSGVDDPEQDTGEEKDRSRHKKPLRRPRISLLRQHVVDEAEHPDSDQNCAHDVEDRHDTDAAERRVEASRSLLDRYRDLLQSGQVGQVVGDHLSHGGSFASACSAVREHHNSHRDEPSDGHVPTLFEDAPEAGNRAPTRTGSRFAAPRFCARFGCRRRRVVGRCSSQTGPRTAHSPAPSWPQSVGDMRPFSDPPKRDKDRVATCPAGRTQHQQRAFIASEEILSAVDSRSSPAPPPSHKAPSLPRNSSPIQPPDRPSPLRFQRPTTRSTVPR